MCYQSWRVGYLNVDIWDYFVMSFTAIELNPNYIRAILRRAELYEKTDKLDEALEDYKTVLEKEPGIPAAREACMVSDSD